MLLTEMKPRSHRESQVLHGASTEAGRPSGKTSRGSTARMNACFFKFGEVEPKVEVQNKVQNNNKVQNKDLFLKMANSILMDNQICNEYFCH